MKRFMLIMLAIICFMPSYIYADKPNNGDTPINIPINPPIGTPSNKPRSLVEQDIEATYCDGILTVVFNENLGDSNITVTNISSGEVWSDSISGYGIATLFLSGDEGYYYIAIDTEEGQYTGEYEL